MIELTDATMHLVATIATLKADPVLQATRVIASAAPPLPDAARRSGADQVLPQTVLAAHLAQFLAEAAV